MIANVQIISLQADMAELEDRLAMRDSELERMRNDLEASVRDEVADSNPVRLRQAQQRAADLDAKLAAKEVGPCHILMT